MIILESFFVSDRDYYSVPDSPSHYSYEVREGSILKDNAYTGIAIRTENVTYADNSGYINYYTTDNSKVRAGTNIYTLSNEKLTFSNGSSEDNVTLSEEQKMPCL